MTDPTVPAPQPEALPEPERSRRRRRLSKKWGIALVVGFFVALVLGGAAYGVHAKGDSKAEEYEKAVDVWNDQKNELIGTPSAANTELWEINDDPTKKKSLAAQKVACDNVLTLRDEAAKNAAALPKEPDNFFKILTLGRA